MEEPFKFIRILMYFHVHISDNGLAFFQRRITLEMRKKVMRNMENIAKFAKMVGNYFAVIIALEHII